MYLLLKMGIFQPAMLVYQRVSVIDNLFRPMQMIFSMSPDYDCHVFA